MNEIWQYNDLINIKYGNHFKIYSTASIDFSAYFN